MELVWRTVKLVLQLITIMINLLTRLSDIFFRFTKAIFWGAALDPLKPHCVFSDFII